VRSLLFVQQTELQMDCAVKLYVDDTRIPPKGEDWILARTITEAIRIIDTESITEVSLDHDICYVNTESGKTTDETFEPVARFIACMNHLHDMVGIPRIKVSVHSGNPIGKAKMLKIINDHS